MRIKGGTPSELKKVHMNITASLKEISWLSFTHLDGLDSVSKVIPREQSLRRILAYRIFMRSYTWDQLIPKGGR